MQQANKSRTPETPDEIWLLQHPPVFTLGLAGKPEHLLAPGNIPVFKIDRGGQVTYHGPGQLVVYLLLDLKRLGFGVKELVKRIEQSVIYLLAEYGIESYRRSGMPGVYVNSPSPQPLQGALPASSGSRSAGGAHAPPNPGSTLPLEGGRARPSSLPPRGGGTEGEGDGRKLPPVAKIAAIGLRVANHATYHGLSLNIDVDLEPFSRINPCGHAGLAVTQMQDFGVNFGNKDKMQIIADRLSAHLSQQLYGMHHG